MALPRRTKVDWANQVKWVLDERYPESEKKVLIQIQDELFPTLNHISHCKKENKAVVKTLYDMRNAKITEVIFIYDYWQIITDKYRVSIYNPLKYKTRINEYSNFCDIYISSIINHIIVDVKLIETELVFELDNKCFVAILLSDEDYSEPEAASVCFKTGEIMVIS